MIYKVERAIIVAAGFGSRLLPVTKNVPKPLIRVNGVRMIDTIIDGLHKNGINDIVVVVGYLKEQFFDLEEKHPGLKVIENPYYGSCNNISSLFVARDYLDKNVMILDSDQFIYNDEILKPEFELSGYNAVFTNKETNEWLMDVKDGIVQSCSRTGGKKGYQLFSISRWNFEDANKLKKHLFIQFEKEKNRQIYWDDVPMFCYPEEYKLGIMQMNFGDIIEIDTLEELIELDDTYKKYLEEK